MFYNWIVFETRMVNLRRLSHNARTNSSIRYFTWMCMYPFTIGWNSVYEVITLMLLTPVFYSA